MKISSFILVTSISVIAFSAHAATIVDTDFSAWSFDSTGTATVSREASDGNPGARLNITTVSGVTVYGTAIKTDFSTDQILQGTPFELARDVLSGPGSIHEGQRIHLLVEQNSNIYASNLDITGYPHNWDTLTFTGSFIDSNFSLLIGSGPATPDFSGGTETLFGFSGSNTISGTLTQYYDNYNLHIVPIPPAILLFGSALIPIFGIMWRRNA
jgi:hypothetical protein